MSGLEIKLTNANHVDGVEMGKTKILKEALEKFPIGSKIKLSEMCCGSLLVPPLEHNKHYTVKNIIVYKGLDFIQLVKDFESDEDERKYEYFLNRFEPVESSCTNINSSCPQCNGKLIEKYSDWAGGNIKKCKSCEWC